MKYYLYEFANSFMKYMTPQEANAYSLDNNTAIIRDSLERNRAAPRLKRSSDRDNVVEGWNPGLGTYVKSKTHYKQILKDKGLECTGNEYVAPKVDKVEKGISEEVIRGAVAEGAELSGREIEHLRKGD